MLVQDLHIDELHHAYLLNGGLNDSTILESNLERIFNVELIKNPDVLIKKAHAFQVNDAREVVEYVSKSALVLGAKKIILIHFSNITTESQNILLKTLEEPAKDTHIFIITPNVDMLLPTVLSRCMRIQLQSNKEDHLAAGTSSDSVEGFIKSSIPERLKIIDKIDKGKDKSENKAKMLEILSGIEEYLDSSKPELDNNEQLLKWKLGAEAVLQAQRYMRDKGAMSKMLMESVAIVL